MGLIRAEGAVMDRPARVGRTPGQGIRRTLTASPVIEKRKMGVTSNNTVHTIHGTRAETARQTSGPIFGTSVLCFGKQTC
jgi:hypothetical protein